MVTDIVTIALNTGMRQRELFCLCWSDVDLGRGLIHVRATKVNKERFVPINLTARALLERLSHSADSVFPSPKTGRALVDVKRQFDRAKHTAGLQDFRFHDLRHTVATRLADNGVDIFTIASILGHSDIRTTWRYTHASDRARRAADKY
jgi:integrase